MNQYKKSITSFIDKIDYLVGNGLKDKTIMDELYKHDFTIEYNGIVCKLPCNADSIAELTSFLNKLDDESILYKMEVK